MRFYPHSLSFSKKAYVYMCTDFIPSGKNMSKNPRESTWLLSQGPMPIIGTHIWASLNNVRGSLTHETEPDISLKLSSPTLLWTAFINVFCYVFKPVMCTVYFTPRTVYEHLNKTNFSAFQTLNPKWNEEFYFRVSSHFIVFVYVSKSPLLHCNSCTVSFVSMQRAGVAVVKRLS